MFDEDMAEGMRETQKLMAEQNLPYDEARRKVLDPLRDISEADAYRLLAIYRGALVSHRNHREEIDSSIAATIEKINGLKRRAMVNGWNLR
jgi:hypothetical protein